MEVWGGRGGKEEDVHWLHGAKQREEPGTQY